MKITLRTESNKLLRWINKARAEKWLLAARRKYQEFWPHWERLLVGPAATTGIAQRDLSNDPDADDGPTHIQLDVDIDITERHA